MILKSHEQNGTGNGNGNEGEKNKGHMARRKALIETKAKGNNESLKVCEAEERNDESERGGGSVSG